MINISLIFVLLYQSISKMELTFYKYQGTGNDFVMIDNRQATFPVTNVKLIESLCDRRFGIGADGLILLENDTQADFKMVYFNSDGNQSTMCGNGGRCISLQMKNVETINITPKYVFLDTGSPHHVEMVSDLKNFDIKQNGAEIRYSTLYEKSGSNVNFVEQINENTFAIRTYERGVEDETLSCGTGATAVAIAMKKIGKTDSNDININVQGGNLSVSFTPMDTIFTNVFLKGPAKFVFEGVISI